MRNWKCYRDGHWNFQSLRAHYGANLFTCGINSITNDVDLIKMDEYFDLFIDPRSPKSKLYHEMELFSRPYIFDPSFEFENEDILDDYCVPSLFDDVDRLKSLPERYRPDYRWFLLGCVGSGSPLHVDPCHTSAWNATVVGKKLWVLINPLINNSNLSLEESILLRIQNLISAKCFKFLITDGREFSGHDDVQFCHNLRNDVIDMLISSKAISASSLCSVVVLVQHPGEIIYVPAGWIHAALNITPTVAVTHNFLEVTNTKKFFCAYKEELPSKFSEDDWKEIANMLDHH